jgi:hypothetical protein
MFYFLFIIISKPSDLFSEADPRLSQIYSQKQIHVYLHILQTIRYVCCRVLHKEFVVGPRTDRFLERFHNFTDVNISPW